MIRRSSGVNEEASSSTSLGVSGVRSYPEAERRAALINDPLAVGQGPGSRFDKTIGEPLPQLLEFRRDGTCNVRLIGMQCGVVSVIVFRRIERVERLQRRHDRPAED